jgi:putative SOS response-associated peptidase YedK
MCGRYTLRARREAVAAAFDLDDFFELPPRYNIAPTQWVPAVRFNPDIGEREFSAFKWGLIPPWVEEPGIGNRLINARAETVAERPAFRSAFRRRRCPVISDGFYEWKQEGGKTPYYFRLRDGGPFAFAGLWERWEKGEEPVESCTLITTEASGVVGQVHGRMPVILKPENYAGWLDPEEQRPAALAELLAPLPEDWMAFHPVSKLVNNPRNESPRCVEPVSCGACEEKARQMAAAKTPGGPSPACLSSAPRPYDASRSLIAPETPHRHLGEPVPSFLSSDLP